MAKTKCSECNGEGWRNEIDIMNARSKREKCKACGGSGYEDGDRLDVLPIPGKSFWLRRYNDHKLVSWAKVRLIPVMKQVGQRALPSHMVWEIDYIETKKEFRRKGYASGIVDKMKHAFRGEVKYILTNWRDSSAEARAMLKRCGFTRDGEVLIWKREV